MMQGRRPWTWAKFHRELERATRTELRFARAVELLQTCTTEELDRAHAMRNELAAMRAQVDRALSVVALAVPAPELVSALRSLNAKIFDHALELRNTLDREVRRTGLRLVTEEITQ